MAVSFFRCPSSNSVAEYERVRREASVDLDALDWEILTQGYRQFCAIYHEPEICLLWARAFGRLEIIEEEGEVGEYCDDWPDKHQSCMALAERSIELFEGREEVLTPLVQVCRRTELFFRKRVRTLGFLYRRMEEAESLHSLQLASLPTRKESCLNSPPPSRLPKLGQWTYKHWPKRHCVSWGHAASVFRGIIGDAPIVLDGEWGLSVRQPLSELLYRRDWQGAMETVQEVALTFLGLFRKPGFPEERCVSFVPTIDRVTPAMTVFLIRAGISPFAVMDISERVSQKPTEWREGAASPYYIPFFHAACQFGTKEMVEAFLEDKRPFRRYYKKVEGSDTPYRRALLNERYPSVLIPLLREGKEDPEGGLAQEIAALNNLEHFPCGPFGIGVYFAKREWRSREENRLLLACVGGDLIWARYVVEQEEEKIRARLISPLTEEDREMAVFVAVGHFVSCPGVGEAPSGTPVEVAARFKHPAMIQFLCEKGANASLEVRVEAAHALAQQVDVVMHQWQRAQADIQQEIARLRIEATKQQHDEMASLVIGFRNTLRQQKQETQSFQGTLQQMDAAITRLERSADRLKQSSQKVVQHYGKTYALGPVLSTEQAPLLARD